MLNTKSLEGIRVLDLTQAYSGPFCTMFFGDHGAEVIKIERPGMGDQNRTWGPLINGESGFHAHINRNKRGLTLNMKAEEGKEVFRKLIETADVVCENYKNGVLEGLGFSYEEMKKINPRIIYANITGFGTSGPLADRPCYDIVAQAMGGLMDCNGYPDGPPVRTGPSLADNFSGALLAIGVLMALYKREKTGEGCHVDVAMVDTVMHVLDHFILDYSVGGEVISRGGNRDYSIAPFDSFDAADGMFVIGCGTDKMFANLCEIMEMPELAEDPRFLTNVERCENYEGEDGLRETMLKFTRTKTIDWLEERIVAKGIPFARVMNSKEVVENPQTKVRNMLWEVDQPKMGKITIPGNPIKISYEEDKLDKRAPMLGEDNEDILKEIGYTKEQIDELAAKEVI